MSTAKAKNVHTSKERSLTAATKLKATVAAAGSTTPAAKPK